MKTLKTWNQKSICEQLTNKYNLKKWQKSQNPFKHKKGKVNEHLFISFSKQLEKIERIEKIEISKRINERPFKQIILWVL